MGQTVSRRSGTSPALATETARLEAFADGIMAIAITLLILEIPVPHVEEGSLGASVFGRQYCEPDVGFVEAHAKGRLVTDGRSVVRADRLLV
jgi:hypothetical protein